MKVDDLFEDTLEFRNIPDALDKDKDIIVNGEKVGSVSRGWLRLGGEQWVASLPVLPNESAFGEKTLKALKRKIAFKLKLKLDEEVELLPRSEVPNAEKLAKQFVDVVYRRFGSDAEPDVKAKQMASNFHQSILKSIDEEIKFRRMKKAHDGFRGKA